jgi:hypothetical protein
MKRYYFLFSNILKSASQYRYITKNPSFPKRFNLKNIKHLGKLEKKQINIVKEDKKEVSFDPNYLATWFHKQVKMQKQKLVRHHDKTKSEFEKPTLFASDYLKSLTKLNKKEDRDALKYRGRARGDRGTFYQDSTYIYHFWEQLHYKNRYHLYISLEAYEEYLFKKEYANSFFVDIQVNEEEEYVFKKKYNVADHLFFKNYNINDIELINNPRLIMERSMYRDKLNLYYNEYLLTYRYERSYLFNFPKKEWFEDPYDLRLPIIWKPIIKHSPLLLMEMSQDTSLIKLPIFSDSRLNVSNIKVLKVAQIPYIKKRFRLYFKKKKRTKRIKKKQKFTRQSLYLLFKLKLLNRLNKKHKNHKKTNLLLNLNLFHLYDWLTDFPFIQLQNTSCENLQLTSIHSHVLIISSLFKLYKKTLLLNTFNVNGESIYYYYYFCILNMDINNYNNVEKSLQKSITNDNKHSHMNLDYFFK